MALMTSKAPTILPTKAPAAGAGQLVGGLPGMSAGLSEQGTMVGSCRKASYRGASRSGREHRHCYVQGHANNLWSGCADT